MVFVSVSSICGQTAAVCGKERLRRVVSTPPGAGGAASPATAGIALRGMGPAAKGSHGRKEGGSGLRRRAEAWA